MIRVDPWTYVFGAFLILVLPLNWLIAAICAAAFHELCHVICIYLCGGRIWNVRIGVGGASIETSLSGKQKELFCVLAGPAGSLMLLLVCHVFPRLAVCAGIQGFFNLLPVYPLDGGRALSCILGRMWPGKEEKIGRSVAMIFLLGLLALTIAGSFIFSLGQMPILAAMLLILKVILRKSPCKRSQIRVQ